MTLVSGRAEPQLLDMIDRAVTALEQIAGPPPAAKPPLDLTAETVKMWVDQKVDSVLFDKAGNPVEKPLQTNEEIVTLQEMRERVQYILQQVNKAQRHLIDDRDRLKKGMLAPGEKPEYVIPRDSREHRDNQARIVIFDSISKHLRYALGMTTEDPKFI